jgi:hypothetical protein
MRRPRSRKSSRREQTTEETQGIDAWIGVDVSGARGL